MPIEVPEFLKPYVVAALDAKAKELEENASRLLEDANRSFAHGQLHHEGLQQLQLDVRKFIERAWGLRQLASHIANGDQSPPEINGGSTR